MKKIYKKFLIQVLEFSPIHFRICGLIEVDYWPSTGRVWIVGTHKSLIPIEPREAFYFAENGLPEELPEGAYEHMKEICKE